MPYEKWFVNLTTVGNVGAASVYFMVDELFHSSKLKKTIRIFLLVPTRKLQIQLYVYMLTVV